MSVCILVTCPPGPAALAAPREVSRARDAGRTVTRVFFQGEGVGHAARPRGPLTAHWRQLAGGGLDLAVCSTAAARRGIGAGDLRPGFRLAGLAQLLEGLLAADAFVCCGPGGRVLRGVPAADEKARGVLVQLTEARRPASTAQEAVETALMAAAFGQPVRLLLTGAGAEFVEPERRAAVPGLCELLPLLEACYVVADDPGGPPDCCTVVTTSQAELLVSSAAACMAF